MLGIPNCFCSLIYAIVCLSTANLNGSLSLILIVRLTVSPSGILCVILLVHRGVTLDLTLVLNLSARPSAKMFDASVVVAAAVWVAAAGRWSIARRVSF